jgi:hypothetical protein
VASTQPAAFANVVNLRPADMPGFTATPNKAGSNQVAGGTATTACLGIGTPGTNTVGFHTDGFQRGNGLLRELVASYVTVWSTAGAVRNEFQGITRAIHSPEASRCLIRAFKQATGAKIPNGRVSAVKVRLTPVALGSVAGTYGNFGLSLSTTATYSSSLPVGAHPLRVTGSTYLDLLGVAVGRAEVELAALSVDRPFPSASEARLFSLLVSRAISASHEYPAMDQ